MLTTPLITPAEAAALIEALNVVFVDTRFRLADTDYGRRSYAEAHIPGAVYAHLDEDLSGTIIHGETSRHPLPVIADFAETLGDWGIGNATQVVVYDDLGGAIAGRLWWMLRWLGHEPVAVLDGGWPIWLEGGFPTTDVPPRHETQTFIAHEQAHLVATMAEVRGRLNDRSLYIMDARAPKRYAGLEEPLDPVAGHIPGAENRFFKDNLGENGAFRLSEVLRERFAGMGEASEVICYCGSGVTAAHNALAMVHAGLPMPRLYAGSWSEWITDPSNPIAPTPAL
ncbi:MAG: sulfurtransferase [Rhodothermales bacterium]